jgi:Septum formation
MTLREESGTGPPAEPLASAGPVTGAGRPEPAAPGPAEAGASPAGPGSSDARPGRPPRRRRSRAALLIGGLAAVGLIGLASLAALLLHGRAHAAPAALPSVFGLRVGECVNSGPGGVSSPTVVPCARAHDAEIYARFALAGPRWPGTAGIGALARRGCTARIGGYLNPQLATAVLAESYVFPGQGAWNAGERTVICEIRSTAGRLTGSVRGLG